MVSYFIHKYLLYSVLHVSSELINIFTRTYSMLRKSYSISAFNRTLTCPTIPKPVNSKLISSLSIHLSVLPSMLRETEVGSGRKKIIQKTNTPL